MQKQTLRVLTVIAAGLPADSGARPLAIQNAGFETTVLNAGAWSNTVEGWEKVGADDTSFVEHITGFSAQGNNHVGLNESASVKQTLTGKFRPNTTYILDTGVGNRVGHTQTGNKSTYDIADHAGSVWSRTEYDAKTNLIDNGFVSAATPGVYATGSWPEVPMGRNVATQLTAGGTGRSHFDNVTMEAATIVSKWDASEGVWANSGARWADSMGGDTLVGNGTPAFLANGTPIGCGAVDFDGGASDDAMVSLPGAGRFGLNGAVSFTAVCIFSPDGDGGETAGAGPEWWRHAQLVSADVGGPGDDWGLGYRADKVYFGVGDSRGGAEPSLTLDPGTTMTGKWWIAVCTWTAADPFFLGRPAIRAWLFDDQGVQKDFELNDLGTVAANRYNLPRVNAGICLGGERGSPGSRNYDGKMALVQLYDGPLPGSWVTSLAGRDNGGLSSAYLANGFPKTRLVTNLNDSGAGSLRQAIIDAQTETVAPQYIRFSVSGAINLQSPLPVLTTFLLHIDGGGQDVSIDGGGQHRCFEVAGPNAYVRLRHLHIRNGRADIGGGLLLSQGTAEAEGCRFSGNHDTSHGAAIFAGFNADKLYLRRCAIVDNVCNNSSVWLQNSASLFASHCTLANNTSASTTSGITFAGRVPCDVRNCTIVENRSNGTQGDGAGLWIQSQPPPVLLNNIIANNRDANGPSAGVYINTSAANYAPDNFLDGDPLLAPRLENTGTDRNLSFVPLPGSPVINAGNNANVVDLVEQRMLPRINDGTVDYGATEYYRYAVTSSDGGGGAGTLADGFLRARHGYADYVDARGLTGSVSPSADYPVFFGATTLLGPGARTTEIHGSGQRTLFKAGARSYLKLQDVSITNMADFAAAADPFGTLIVERCRLSQNVRGIVNSGGSALITDSYLVSNVGANGRGIESSGGTTSLTQCTLVNNGPTANPRQGGAIHITGGGNLLLNRSTLYQNTGGLWLDNANVSNVTNTCISASVTGPDVVGTILTNQFNFIGGDPRLPSSASNFGGPTDSLPPLPNSPLINTGDNTVSSGSDVRGHPRVRLGRMDIGAVEYQPPAGPTIVLVRGGNPLLLRFTWPTAPGETWNMQYTTTSLTSWLPFPGATGIASGGWETSIDFFSPWPANRRFFVRAVKP